MERMWKRIFQDFVESITLAIDIRDFITVGHSKRVSLYVQEICNILGLEEEEKELYTLAGLLHDVGKVGVPSDILYKPTKLSDEEFELVKKHTDFGYAILNKIRFPNNLKTLPHLVRAHHERLDGSGYPMGLKNIPFGSQIISVADTVDAISSRRQYQNRRRIIEVLDILEEERGIKLNKEVINAFKEIELGRLIEILELNKTKIKKDRLEELNKNKVSDLRDLTILKKFKYYYDGIYLDEQTILNLKKIGESKC